jgi:hypothetical protein
VRWKWPADLEREPLVLYAPFSFVSRNLDSGIQWSIRRANPTKDDAASSFLVSHSLLCLLTQETLQFKDSKGPLLWTIQGGNLASTIEAVAKLGLGDFADIANADLENPGITTAPVEFEAGTYGLSELIVLRPSQSGGVDPGRRRFDLLAAVRAPHFGRYIHVAAEPPSDEVVRSASHLFTRAMDWRGFSGSAAGYLPSTPTIEVPKEYWLRVDNEFEARLGQLNEWTIPLPGELIEAVREALKTEKSRAQRPAAKSDAGGGKG